MRSKIAAALPLLLLGAISNAQSQKSISQSTRGECSPAVISEGAVTITCAGLDQQQQTMLRKIPNLIDQLLKRNQSDRDLILGKLEEILELQKDAGPGLGNLKQRTLGLAKEIEEFYKWEQVLWSEVRDTKQQPGRPANSVLFMQSTAERFIPQYEERLSRTIEELRRHNIYDDNFDQTMKVVAWQLNSKPPFMPFYSVTGIIEGLKSLGNSIPN